MMRTGQMRHQIQIEVQSTTQDTSGEQANTWTTFATRRAAVQRAIGSEVVASAQRQGRMPVVFRIRYLEGVTAGMRIIFKGRVHNITSPPVDQEGLGEELIIATEEEGPA